MSHNYIAVLVVLYNKEISQSETLASLANQNVTCYELTLVNNGPNKLLALDDPLLKEIQGKGIKVNYIEFLDNKPLSYIYNLFITENNNCENFVILDDDTQLPEDYLTYCDNKYDILLPIIVHDGKVEYPKGTLRQSNKNSLLSISSGMVLSRRMVDIFLSEFKKIFDERYALYGIDTVFFARLQRLVNKGYNFTVKKGPTISHSLSKNLTGGKNIFRVTERTYDLALTARFYPEAIHYMPRIVYLMKIILTGNFTLLRTFFKVLLIGKHPRCL